MEVEASCGRLVCDVEGKLGWVDTALQAVNETAKVQRTTVRSDFRTLRSCRSW